MAARLPAHVVRAIAVEAGRDPRSVVAALDGRARPMTAAAVKAAMVRLGIELPAPEAKP
jgi:hypothetical protein